MQAGREHKKCQSSGMRAGSEQNGSRIRSEHKQWAKTGENDNNLNKNMKYFVKYYSSVQHTWHTDGLCDHLFDWYELASPGPPKLSAWISSSAHDIGSSRKLRTNLKSFYNVIGGHVLQCSESWQWEILAASYWSHMTDTPAHRWPTNMSICLIYNTFYWEFP